jgi:hypothetical protein
VAPFSRYRPTQLLGQLPPELARELSGGEQLLWHGRPVGGVRLRAGDAIQIPFSLLWAGFAVFWEATVITSGAPFFFVLWGIPFVAVGLYITVGRFFHDAWRRSRTAYAVTSERVVILSGGLRPAVTSLRLATIPSLSLAEHRGGVGTISFGGGSAFAGLASGMMDGWPGVSRHLGPRLELVPGARSVYETIEAAQRDAARR